MTLASSQRKVAGPSEGARAKAIEAKRSNRQVRIERLKAVLVGVETRIQSGALQRKSISHETIIEEAGVSPATYWRYLKLSPPLRNLVVSLISDTQKVQVATTAPDAPPISDDPSLALIAAREENTQMRSVNTNLRIQISACKTLIGLLNIELSARNKEVMSKDSDLSAERKRTVDLLNSVAELVAICEENNIEIALDLSKISSPTAARRN